MRPWHKNNNNTKFLAVGLSPRSGAFLGPWYGRVSRISRYSHHHDLWNAHGNYSGPGWGAKDDFKAVIPELFYEKKNNFVSEWSSSRDVALVLCTSTHRGSAGRYRRYCNGYCYCISSTYITFEFRRCVVYIPSSTA